MVEEAVSTVFKSGSTAESPVAQCEMEKLRKNPTTENPDGLFFIVKDPTAEGQGTQCKNHHRSTTAVVISVFGPTAESPVAQCENQKLTNDPTAESLVVRCDWCCNNRVTVDLMAQCPMRDQRTGYTAAILSNLVSGPTAESPAA